MCVACVSRGVSAHRVGGETCKEGDEGEQRRPRWRPARLGAVLAAVLVVLLSGVPARAVVGGTPIADGDRRFDAVAVLLTDTPWAPCGGWVSGTCTLVGPNLVLMARHSVEDAQRRLPGAGMRTHKVRFRRSASGGVNGRFGRGQDLDCGGGYQEIYIHEFYGNPGSGLDMVVGVLEREPAGITPMRMDLSHTYTAGEPVTLAGWGFDGPCLGTGQAWTLRSRSGVLPSQTYSSWCCFDYNHASFTGENCFIVPPWSNWVIGNLHDSGAPLLSPDPADPSRLRLIAIVTYVTSAQKVSAWNEGGGLPALSDAGGVGCAADVNGNGVAEVGDLLLFVNRFFDGDGKCDIDGTPGLEMTDLFTFLNRYFAGC